MITEQEYRTSKTQLDKAKNKEQVTDTVTEIVEKLEPRLTPMERYWMSRGVVIGYLVGKGRK